MFDRVFVNGNKADPLFKWLKNTIKVPQDPKGESNNGSGIDDYNILINKNAETNTTYALWYINIIEFRQG